MIRLYRGNFNYYQIPIALYSKSKNEDQAYHNFIYQLSIKLNIDKKSLYNYFNGSKDNYTIFQGVA